MWSTHRGAACTRDQKARRCGPRCRCAVEKEDAAREGVREVSRGGVEDAFAIRTEPTESDAECVRKMISGRLGVEFFDVVRKRRAFGAIDGELSPFLSVPPPGWAGLAELD